MPGFRLKIDLKNAQSQVAFFKSWPDRLKKIEPMLGYKAADYVKNHVLAKLPKTADTKSYRQSLEVVRVKGTQPGEYAYAVRMDEKSKDIKEIKPNQNLIYVSPSSRFIRPPPSVLVLQKYSPWTIDTLPFKPDARVASVVVQPARPAEVLRASLAKQRSRSRWAQELTRTGVKVPGRFSKPIDLGKDAQKLPTAALDALRMEFGLGGKKSNPAWRLAFQHLAKSGLKSFMKDKKNFITPLTDPSFKLWQKWPNKTQHTISIAKAKTYKAFQDKILGRRK